MIIQVSDAEDVRILKGVVSKDHVHMHIEYPLKLSISDFVKRVKGRSSRLWAIGFGTWSTGNVTEELIQKYLEHHKKSGNRDDGNIILEEDF